MTDNGSLIAKDHGIARSPRWPGVERTFLKAFPWCAACGKEASPQHLQVHHVMPFHFAVLLGRPDLELDTRNLISLCLDHHLLCGHLDSFKSFNAHVRHDTAGRFHGKSKAEIMADPVWSAMAKHKPLMWDRMSVAAKEALRVTMNAMYPL